MFTQTSIDVLGNGITVVTDPVPGLKTVACALVLSVGGYHDPWDKQGLAHKSEHMVDCGIPGMSGDDFRRFTRRLGVYDTAEMMTFGQKTVYTVCATPERSWTYLDKLAESLIHLDFSQRDHDIQTGRIVNEMLGILDDPEEMEDLYFLKSAYGNCAYSRIYGGLPEHLKLITLDDVLGFYSKNLVGSNLKFYATGAISRSDAIKWAEKKFGHLRAGTPAQEICCAFKPSNRIQPVSWRSKTTSVSLIYDLPTAALDCRGISAIGDDILTKHLKHHLEDRIGMYHAAADSMIMTDNGGLKVIKCSPDDEARKRDIDIGKTVQTITKLIRSTMADTCANTFEEGKAEVIALTETDRAIISENTQDRLDLLMEHIDPSDPDSAHFDPIADLKRITLDDVQTYWHEAFSSVPATCYIGPDKDHGNRSYPTGQNIRDMIGLAPTHKQEAAAADNLHPASPQPQF